MGLLPQIIRKTIDAKALEFGIDADLIEAFVLTESSGNPKATRYEANFYKRYIQPMLINNEIAPHEAIGRSTSWGLMQIMGQVAREKGFKGEFQELFEPATNLTWSLKHLKHFIDKYKDMGRDYAIASYNAGSPRIKDGKFVNQAYVDKVQKYYEQVKGA